MLVVRCRDCNKEIISHETQSKSCGCPNMTTVTGEVVTAVDLNKVIMVQSAKKESKQDSLFSPQELQFQEQRRKRKIRKLDFEVR
tara:strand:- start:1408 stop:1662 length:255 start_codon:yes stop_codon:yes gene_type:complete